MTIVVEYTYSENIPVTLSWLFTFASDGKARLGSGSVCIDSSSTTDNNGVDNLLENSADSPNSPFSIAFNL